MSFRNTVGTTAVTNVQAFLARFKTPDLKEAYVKSGMVYYKEIPFLYRVFDVTEVSSKTEKGGYKVVRAFSLIQP